MAIHKVKTFTNIGINGYEVIVEADCNKSLPTIEIVGLPDATIKESRERIRATFRNSNIELPPRKIILNLAPSDIKKIGTKFDLPMAVAILLLINEGNIIDIENYIFFGELGLDGTVKKIGGILPSVISAYKKGYTKFFIPYENTEEIKFIKGIQYFPLKNFIELVNIFYNGDKIYFFDTCSDLKLLDYNQKYNIDFKDIKGHILAKRAISISASGLHNILMIGPPGSGKTILSKSIKTILPDLDFEDILEISQIYSVAGLLNNKNPLMVNRPFRQVHHTASKISIVGGGQNLLPGEISLAHKGILFFDELPEFPSQVLEVLRQPLEEKKITISRANGNVSYPSNFMFIAAMNPCKCGFYKDIDKQCICSKNDIKKYQSRISGPIIDRFDIILEIPRQDINNLLQKDFTDSSEILKNKVINAWEIQKKRYKGTGIISNADINYKDIEKYIILDEKTEYFFKNAIKSLLLSPRQIHRLLKLSRSIADFENCENIDINHIAESLHYRSRSMFLEM